MRDQGGLYLIVLLLLLLLFLLLWLLLLLLVLLLLLLLLLLWLPLLQLLLSSLRNKELQFVTSVQERQPCPLQGQALRLRIHLPVLLPE